MKRLLALTLMALGLVAAGSAQETKPMVLVIPIDAAYCQNIPSQFDCTPHIEVEVFNVPAKYSWVKIVIRYNDADGAEQVAIQAVPVQSGQAAWGIVVSNFTDAKGYAFGMIDGPRL